METLRWLWELIPEAYRVEIFGGLVSAILFGTLIVFRNAIGSGFKRLFGKNKTEPQQQLQPAPPAQLPPINITLTQPPALPAPPSPESDPVAPKKNAPTALSNIPPASSVGFVPRRDDTGRNLLEMLTTALEPKNNQLVALHGAGGIGKTTLASETARALLENYAGRVIWISTENKNFTLISLLDEIARSLNRDELRRLRDDEKREEVKRALAQSPTLVVLDNFETVPEAEQKPCIDFLFNDSPYPALITTRQPIDKAQNIPVYRMQRDEATEYLKRLIEQTHFGKLFTDDVCEKTMQVAERNPLLMKWVVGQIGAASLAKEVFEVLAKGKGEAAERVFDRSFNLEQVGEAGRTVMMALALFTPSASREALAGVAGLGDDLEQFQASVGRLAGLWLLDTTPDGERLMLEGLTKDLAYSRLLRRADTNEYRARFVAYFLAYAQRYSARTPEAYDQLEPEKDNLMNAVDKAFDSGDWESVMKLMNSINGDGVDGFLPLRGHWNESIQGGEKAMAAARNISDEAQVAHFAHNLAIMYQRRGDLAEAFHLYNDSLTITKQLGNQSSIASTLHQLAMLAQDTGELDEARHLYNDSLTIKKQLGNQQGIAITLHELGRLAQATGDLEEARRLYNESLTINKQLGNQSGIAISQHQLAMLAQNTGELEEARRLYNESLTINKQLGDPSGIAITLHELGRLEEKEGKIDEAIRLLREAIVIYEKLRHPYVERARNILARLESKKKE